jgi:hypothetical protein
LNLLVDAERLLEYIHDEELIHLQDELPEEDSKYLLLLWSTNFSGVDLVGYVS